MVWNELNLIASDDEFLVRPIFARNVVLRVKSTEPATLQRIETLPKVEDSNANPAPTWRDRDSTDDEVCKGGVRNADGRASTPPSEVDALKHDLPEVFAMSDDGRTGVHSEPPVTAYSVHFHRKLVQCFFFF